MAAVFINPSVKQDTVFCRFNIRLGANFFVFSSVRAAEYKILVWKIVKHCKYLSYYKLYHIFIDFSIYFLKIIPANIICRDVFKQNIYSGFAVARTWFYMRCQAAALFSANQLHCISSQNSWILCQ